MATKQEATIRTRKVFVNRLLKRKQMVPHRSKILQTAWEFIKINKISYNIKF